MEITVKQMMQIEENGHQMGFLRKFMMENAGASAVKRLIEKTDDISTKKVLIFAGLGNNGGDAFVIRTSFGRTWCKCGCCAAWKSRKNKN